jgi:hypothetical protein
MTKDSRSLESSKEPILDDFESASKFLGLTVWQLRGLVANGDLAVITVGRKFYFRRSTLLRWAERAEAAVGQR